MFEVQVCSSQKWMITKMYRFKSHLRSISAFREPNMPFDLEEKKVVRYALTTKSVSITIANFEEVIDCIRDEEITSRVLEVREVQFR